MKKQLSATGPSGGFIPVFVLVAPKQRAPRRGSREPGPAYTAPAPESRPIPNEVAASALPWSTIEADTREWSKRTASPLCVEVEHWGP
jgi:hypothetical protein